jgi:hypothetical protein
MTKKHKLQIGYTTAPLAVGHEAGREHERLREAAVGGKLGKGDVAALRRGSWLGGECWRRGAYFTTSGLRAGAGHPELVLMNVPGAFAPWAQELLNEIGSYVLDSGKRLRSGEVFRLTDSRFGEMSLTFDLLEPGQLSSPPFDRQMLLILPLP